MQLLAIPLVVICGTNAVGAGKSDGLFEFVSHRDLGATLLTVKSSKISFGLINSKKELPVPSVRRIQEMDEDVVDMLRKMTHDTMNKMRDMKMPDDMPKMNGTIQMEIISKKPDRNGNIEMPGNQRRVLQESNNCDAENAAVARCLSTQSCADCLNNAFSNTINDVVDNEGTCGDIEDGICLAITDTCTCIPESCQDDAEQLYTCVLQDFCMSGFDCSPQPELCAAERDAYASCGTTAECVECKVGIFNPLTDDFAANGNCQEMREGICTLNDQCTCDTPSCDELSDEFFGCVVAEIGCSGGTCVAPTPQPTSRPTTPPTTAPTTTVDECATERSAIVECIPSQACAECLNDEWNALLSQDSVTCGEAENGVCLAITETCSCLPESCHNDAAQFYSCLVEDSCSFRFDCNRVAPTSAPSSSSTPDACAIERTAIAQCTPTQECADCMDDAWADTIEMIGQGSFFCQDVADGICPAILGGCSCFPTECQDEAENFYGCLLREGTNGSCPGVNCDTVASPTPPPASTPAPQPCESLRQAATSCLPTQACSDCLEQTYNTAVWELFGGSGVAACRGFEDVVCPAITTDCNCGFSCAESVEDYYGCMVESMSSGMCAGLECNPPTTVPTAPPTLAPTRSPTAAPSPAPTTIPTESDEDGSSSSVNAVILGSAIGGVLVISATIVGIAYARSKTLYGPSEKRDPQVYEYNSAFDANNQSPPPSYPLPGAPPTVSSNSSNNTPPHQPPHSPIPAGNGTFQRAHSPVPSESYQRTRSPVPYNPETVTVATPVSGYSAQTPPYEPQFKDQTRTVMVVPGSMVPTHANPTNGVPNSVSMGDSNSVHTGITEPDVRRLEP